MKKLLVLVAFLAGCGSTPAPSAPTSPASAVLVDETGKSAALSEHANKGGLTVLLFFTPECPVQKAHDTRMRELVDAYGPRGVKFLAIASEASSNIAAERDEAKRRTGMPLLEDKGAALADALGVEYSTHVVLLDEEQNVAYSGALDGDRTHLTDSAERYLKDAIDAKLAKRPVAKAKTEALGCPLRKH